VSNDLYPTRRSSADDVAKARVALAPMIDEGQRAFPLVESVVNGGAGIASGDSEGLCLWDQSTDTAIRLGWTEIAVLDPESGELETVDGDTIFLGERIARGVFDEGDAGAVFGRDEIALNGIAAGGFGSDDIDATQVVAVFGMADVDTRADLDAEADSDATSDGSGTSDHSTTSDGPEVSAGWVLSNSSDGDSTSTKDSMSGWGDPRSTGGRSKRLSERSEGLSERSVASSAGPGALTSASAVPPGASSVTVFGADGSVQKEQGDQAQEAGTSQGDGVSRSSSPGASVRDRTAMILTVLVIVVLLAVFTFTLLNNGDMAMSASLGSTGASA